MRAHSFGPVAEKAPPSASLRYTCSTSRLTPTWSSKTVFARDTASAAKHWAACYAQLRELVLELLEPTKKRWLRGASR